MREKLFVINAVLVVLCVAGFTVWFVTTLVLSVIR